MADDLPEIWPTTAAQLRQWLDENHGSSRGAWLVAWRRGESGPRIPYDDVVAELLCFGWIDSTLRVLDDDRSALRITPRKPGGGWARSNKERLRRLAAQGRMRPAGEAAVARAKADGSWTLLDDVEELIVPDDLAAQLAAAGATAGYEGLTPGRRKQILFWIKTAKRPETRQRRIAATVAAAVVGKAPQG